jgi:transposase
MAVIEGVCRIVGGVDTHKDLHVAAIVDEQDRIIGTRSFATTRQGYRQMLAWMRSFGELQRIGIESTGSYGAGLLRFMQQAKVTVLEVTTPDKQDRRRRGKNDDLDAQNAAHAALAGQRNAIADCSCVRTNVDHWVGWRSAKFGRRMTALVCRHRPGVR